mmetsp:Transcript_45560/g.116552  ORF Transcript_45560/g.116552 Transcript_45560/m.116552 type:complete len:398 (+) Transcript_45560:248-1441(+)
MVMGRWIWARRDAAAGAMVEEMEAASALPSSNGRGDGASGPVKGPAEAAGELREEEQVQVAATGEAPRVANGELRVAREGCWKQTRRFCVRHRWRLFSAAVLLVVIMLLAAFHEEVSEMWETYSGWLEANKVKGAFSFIIVTAVLTVICFPAAIPTLAAGAIYGMCNGLAAGVAIGTAIIFTGATLGSIVAFLLGRYAFHGWLEHINRRSRWAGALNRALQNNGLKVIILLRLSPIIPYSVFNYLASLTSVRFWDFMLGSIAILPGTALFVFLGAQSAMAVNMSMTDGGASLSTARIAVTVVGVIIALAAVLLLGYYAKRELKRFVPNLATLDLTDSVTHSFGNSITLEPSSGIDDNHGVDAASPTPPQRTPARAPTKSSGGASGHRLEQPDIAHPV